MTDRINNNLMEDKEIIVIEPINIRDYGYDMEIEVCDNIRRLRREKNMTQDVTTRRVAVLVGGWSDESDVSRSSGREVAQALREAGFDTVDLLDVADSGFVQNLYDWYFYIDRYLTIVLTT